MNNRHIWLPIVMIGLCTYLLGVVQVSCAVEQAPTAFMHANLIPMVNEAVLVDHTVTIEADRIAVVGPSSRTDIRPNSTVINYHNKFLMPGLADMHMHLRDNWLSGTWPVSLSNESTVFIFAE